MAKLPTGALERLSIRTSTRPLTPAAAPLATRPENWVAGVEPNVTPCSRTQSPLPTDPIICPPPVSVVAATLTPFCWLNDSAWIWRYASRLPGPVLGVGPGAGLVLHDPPIGQPSVPQMKPALM